MNKLSSYRIYGWCCIEIHLKNGNKRLKVNDDASTKTYLNTDVAAELGLHGQLQKINVSVLNGQVETFETLPVECIIESLDGKVQSRVTAFTTGRVTRPWTGTSVQTNGHT